MNDQKIGLNATQVKDGLEVYYYPWYDKESGNHAEGLKTKIKGDCQFNSAQNYVCFLDNIRGYVLISHLSFDYYPERYEKPNKAKKRYEDYLHADCYHDFKEFLGIQKPVWEIHHRIGFYKLKSVKYHGIESDWHRFKKDAKKDYKEKLKTYLKSIKL